ncbi:putative lipoprotein [Eggerthella sp. HGA1]|nr:putative lipoprotein [Eggerthella sp. HGA1]
MARPFESESTGKKKPAALATGFGGCRARSFPSAPGARTKAA